MDELVSIIKKTSGKFDQETIKNSIIRYWAKENCVDLREISINSTIYEFIRNNVDLAEDYLSTVLEISKPKVNIKDIERVFELFLDAESRKSLGAVYTPDYIIDNLINNGLTFINKDSGIPVICDPACGSGGFLIRAAEIISKKFNISYQRVFSECIVGIDKDPNAIKHAKCIIELFLISKNSVISNEEIRVYCMDTLFCDYSELWKKLNINGFDLIVTNPPYVKMQNLDEVYRKELESKYSSFVKGSYSLAILFLLAGVNLINKKGCVAMITQNNLFTSLSGIEIREYLQKNELLRRILDFNHFKVFNNASAYTCLLFLTHENKEFEYSTIKNLPNEESIEEVQYSKIPTDKLESRKWRLAASEHSENLHRIENQYQRLGELTDIKVGFATLKDKVFTINGSNSQEIIVVGVDKKRYCIEKAILKPFYKIANLNSEEDMLRSDLYIIFPYIEENNKFVLIPEDKLAAQYPQTYKYLLSAKSILETRDKGNKIYPDWYAWGRTQCMKATGPKLLTKTFSNKPNFLFDESDNLFCNGYGIFEKQKRTFFDTTYNLRFIQKIINSQIMAYYSKLTSFQIEGNYQCYQKNFIERFGIPKFSESEIEEIMKMTSQELNKKLLSKYEISQKAIDEVLG